MQMVRQNGNSSQAVRFFAADGLDCLQPSRHPLVIDIAVTLGVDEYDVQVMPVNRMRRPARTGQIDGRVFELVLTELGKGFRVCQWMVIQLFRQIGIRSYAVSETDTSQGIVSAKSIGAFGSKDCL